MKKSIVVSLFLLAIPFAVHAAELKDEAAGASQTIAVSIQGRAAKAGTAAQHITQGPKNGYEVAALFNILEQKGIISKDELSKEIQTLNIDQFSDPDPYTSIR